MARRSGQSGVWTTRIKFSPSAETMAKIYGEAAAEISDLTPAFVKLGPKMIKGVHEIIGSKGALLDKPWPGLKNKYYDARKRRLGWSPAELFASYRTSQAIGVQRITRSALRFGVSGIKYAKALQWGKGKGNIRNSGTSARLFIGVSEPMRATAMDEIQSHVNAAMAHLAAKTRSAA